MDRTYTVDELWAALRRRWKVMALVAGGVLVLAALVIWRIPNEYRGRALVMVEPQSPHPDLVVPVINANSLEEKVKSIRAEVYSRNLLSTAIEELKLYPRERENGGMDVAVEALRNDTEVHAEGDDVFSITVRARDPEVAAKAANRLAELTIESNLQVRAGQVQRTRDIISAKLDQMTAELAKADKKLGAYRQQHKDELPEMVESRLHERDALGKQMEVELGFMQEAQRRIDLLGTQPFGKDTEVGRLEEQVDELRARQGAAQSQLLADHPDVQALQRELQAATGRLQAARARAAANDLELRRMNDAISRSRKRIAELTEKQAAIDKLVSASPMVNTDLVQMTRDVDVLRAKVTQLVSKKAEAEIAAELEMKSAPAEFRVLESAQPPATPASPNRAQAFLLALLAAVALGGAVALGKEMTDRSIRSELEAGEAVSLPVLACVPLLAMTAAPSRMLTVHAGGEA